ncbi:MAG: polysaccharide export protein [Alphaproteobacteria bacterium]|nr:polysaccharide export protein [Alphaproteobacteria bacterium]
MMLYYKRKLRQFALFSLVLIASFHGQISYADAAESLSTTIAIHKTEDPQAPITLGEEYLLGPDDEIKMTVFGEEDLSGPYNVSATGTLSIPLIGDVQASGRTLKEIETEIVKKLKNGYLIDPSVALSITKYRPFYILGEVRLPGSYSYVSGMSVLNAVALAGGFTYRANKKNVQIKRPVHGINSNEIPKKEYTVDAKILPGDVIFIKERFF